MVEQTRKKVRIPLFPSENNRRGYGGTLYNEDARFVNCILDVRQNQYTKEQVVYASKRPGTTAILEYTGLPTVGTNSFDTQGMWVFKDHLLIVNNNKLYVDTSVSSGVSDNPTLIYTFHANTLEATASNRRMWNAFGTDFTNEFAYRAVEILDNGVEALYITNGFEDVFIDKDGAAYQAPLSFPKFVANSTYKAGDKVVPSTYAGWTGYYYIVTGEAGTTYTAAAEPVWPALGASVTSGGATFVCFAAATRSTVAQQYTNRAYLVNDLVQPSVETGLYYKVTTAGTTTAEPTWTQIKGDTCTNNGVVFECMGYYGGKPGLALPSPVYLDTYLVLSPFKSSDLYHCDPADPYSWKATNFISADSFTTPMRAMARYNNYILVLSEKDAELFYNNANQEGSVFSRHESFLLQVGTVCQSSVVNTESLIAWLGVSSSGDNSVWLMDGFEPKEVSTPWVNKLIASQNNGTSTTISSYAMRIAGHLLMVFKLAANTIVYDVGMNVWYQWTSYNGSQESNFQFDFYAFNPASAYDLKQFLMSKEHKELFYISEYIYNDNLSYTSTQPIYMRVITNLIDMDNRNRKFIHSLDIIGDLANDGNTQIIGTAEPNLDVYWSDDDYQNFDPILITVETTIPISVDMSARPRITPMGSFRRRAFMLVYTGNMPMRLEALEITYTQGKS
jgi:hypothetical protein